MIDIGEPCDTCARGIAKFVCFDGRRRCQKCITRFVAHKGWGALVLPLVKVKRKKKSDTDNRDQGSLF